MCNFRGKRSTAAGCHLCANFCYWPVEVTPRRTEHRNSAPSPRYLPYSRQSDSFSRTCLLSLATNTVVIPQKTWLDIEHTGPVNLALRAARRIGSRRRPARSH